jgi:hypothetical protein
MKTFIWNREYEVLVVNAEDVDQARELLRPKLDEFFADTEKEIEEDNIKHLGEDFPCSMKNWTWEKETKSRREYLERDKAIIYEEPEVIVEENEAVIFTHSNE